MVKGVGRLISDENYIWASTVIYDKKVVVLFDVEIFGEKYEIWCAVIKVEKNEQGEICGSVEWCGCVLDDEHCLPVNV